VKNDEQLRQELIAELNLSPLVGAAQIYVSVLNGDVKLTGRVSSVQERAEAERIAYTVAGVNLVSLAIGIVSPDSIVRSDIEMIRSADAASRWCYAAGEAGTELIKYEWDSSGI
jgi:Flp pilus assembly secretin CpaC